MNQANSSKTLSLAELYRRLYQIYGPQGWWPGDGPFDVIIGAILTQATAWSNVELAIRNLKRADHWSFEAIHRCPTEELAALIRPSGYFNAKARKLKAFAAHVLEGYNGDLERFFAQDTAPLRAELLAIYGVGPETADAILVYAAGQPSFVIDAYTLRILRRVGLASDEEPDDYAGWQRRFHQQLPAKVKLFNEYHALLDRHGKDVCRKTPLCSGCGLLTVCWNGQQSTVPQVG